MCSLHLPVDFLCRSLPGKFVCNDVQTRALQHSLCSWCSCSQTCRFALCRFQRQCIPIAGSLTLLQDGCWGEEWENRPREFWKVLSGWCCGPACVNDFLKWRPGPTLCGNRQSRSQNAQRERRGRRMRTALKSSGLDKRYCIKDALAGTLLTSAFKGVFYLLQSKSRCYW